MRRVGRRGIDGGTSSAEEVRYKFLALKSVWPLDSVVVPL